MGLLDSAMGMLGGGNQGGLMKAVAGMLGGGGLEKVLGQFRQGGMGQKADSWVGTGDNATLDAGEIEQIMGNTQQLDHIAQQAGVSREEAARVMAQMLPQAVNHLTPNGQIPQGGVQHNENDLADMLGGMFGRR